jgi:hypothetical protein
MPRGILPGSIPANYPPFPIRKVRELAFGKRGLVPVPGSLHPGKRTPLAGNPADTGGTGDGGRSVKILNQFSDIYKE